MSNTKGRALWLSLAVIASLGLASSSLVLSQSRRQPPSSDQKKNKRPEEKPESDEQKPEPTPPDIMGKQQEAEKVAVTTNLVNVMDYYELAARQTEVSSGTVTTQAVKFIVVSSERGSPETGLIKWTPYPPIPSAAKTCIHINPEMLGIWEANRSRLHRAERRSCHQF